MKPETIWARVGSWAGFDLSPGQIGLLHSYADWLRSEAIVAGGLGPNEADRVDTRHIGDSLLFAAGYQIPPLEILDVGSGVGLPGIPLAIALPKTRLILLDRSARRVELMKRAARILDLPNLEVSHGDLADWDRPMPGVVSRASLSPDRAVVSFERVLTPGGVAVVGGSWAAKPEVIGFDYLEVPATVLDHRVWLLIMRRQ